MTNEMAKDITRRLTTDLPAHGYGQLVRQRPGCDRLQATRPKECTKPGA